MNLKFKRTPNATSAGPFALPTVDLFAKFCRHLVDKSYGIGSLLHQ
eukprot:COSAG01_NODE_70580_length_258_cov_0.654088_1_plen_45_part_10